MLTVSQLARQSGISRATLLYYEREGLIEEAATLCPTRAITY